MSKKGDVPSIGYGGGVTRGGFIRWRGGGEEVEGRWAVPCGRGGGRLTGGQWSLCVFMGRERIHPRRGESQRRPLLPGGEGCPLAGPGQATSALVQESSECEVEKQEEALQGASSPGNCGPWEVRREGGATR